MAPEPIHARAHLHGLDSSAENGSRYGETPDLASYAAVECIALSDGIRSEAEGRFEVLSSFLSLEASRVRRHEGLTASHALEDVRRRVLDVARIHHWLVHPSGPPEVDFGIVLDRIRETLSSTLAEAGILSISCEAHSRPLPAANCVWPALIASELIASAVKYGFTDRRGGRISVFFAAGPGAWILELEDSGSPWRAFGSRRGAGMLVIQALVEFLDGRVEIDEVVGGNRCKIIMPLH